MPDLEYGTLYREVKRKKALASKTIEFHDGVILIGGFRHAGTYYAEEDDGTPTYTTYPDAVEATSIASLGYRIGRYLLWVNGVIVAMEGDKIRDPQIEGDRWNKDSLQKAADLINKTEDIS